MKVMKITKCDLLNGEGCRVVLWVSHCEHKCHFCQNAYCWNGKVGEEYNENHIKEIYEELNKKYISGITFTGGDPLSSVNYKEIIKLSKQIRKDFPNKTQWLWTGYTWEEIIRDKNMVTQQNLNPEKMIMESIITTCDIVIDGPFVEDLYDESIKYRGSSNQRVIDVKESLKRKEIVLYGEA